MSRLPALGPRGEGWTAMQVVLMVAIPFAAWLSARSAEPQNPGPFLRVGGAIVLLGSLALLVLSSVELRRARSFTALPRPLETGTMVQTGPYRLIRHPIYAGVIAAGIGVAMIRVSLLVVVLTLALAVVLDLKRRREEAWLGQRYPEYAGYRARTRAFIPYVY